MSTSVSKVVEEFENFPESDPRFVHVTEVSANAIFAGGDQSKYIIAVDEVGNLYMWLKNERMFKKMEKPTT